MNIIFINTYNRDIKVFSAYATQLKGGGIVLRMGAEIGPLHQIVKGEAGFYSEKTPILINAYGYKAMSSEGFVRVIKSHPVRKVVGVQGFPWQKEKRSLRKADIPVSIFEPGTLIQKVDTGFSGKGFHSNSQQTRTALAGLEMRADALNRSIIAEGQSDFLGAWELVGKQTPRTGIEFPPEHLAHYFSEGQKYHLDKRCFRFHEEKWQVWDNSCWVDIIGYQIDESTNDVVLSTVEKDTLFIYFDENSTKLREHFLSTFKKPDIEIEVWKIGCQKIKKQNGSWYLSHLDSWHEVTKVEKDDERIFVEVQVGDRKEILSWSRIDLSNENQELVNTVLEIYYE